MDYPGFSRTGCLKDWLGKRSERLDSLPSPSLTFAVRGRAQYILRFDDIAPNMHWENFERLRHLAEVHDLRPLIGVIPDNQDPELLRMPSGPQDFWAEIATLQRRGWEVAVHGYQHRYETDQAGLLGVHPRSEFAGLTFDVQRTKLERALAILKTYGITTDTFMAPAHSFDACTLRALRAVGLAHVTDGYALRPFRAHGLVFVPQMFAWPRRMPPGIYTTCFHLNELSAQNMARLERYVKKHRRDIIDFKQAVHQVTDAPYNRVVGWAAKTALHTLRRLRSFA